MNKKQHFPLKQKCQLKSLKKIRKKKEKNLISPAKQWRLKCLKEEKQNPRRHGHPAECFMAAII